MKMKSFAACLCGLLLAATAQAAPVPDQPGIYVGGSLGAAKGKSRVYREKYDSSLGVNLGYRFSSQLSTEVFVRSLNFALMAGFLEKDGYVYPEDHVGVAVRLSAPLGDAFSLYGRLGVGRTGMEATHVNMSSKAVTEATLGGGLGYDFKNSSWGLRMEYLRFMKSDVNAFALGGEYRF